MDNQETLTGDQADEEKLLVSEEKTQRREVKSDVLTELFDRMERIEARQKKIINLLQARQDSDRVHESAAMSELIQEINNSPSGVTTLEVESILEVSKPTALKRMQELDQKHDKLEIIDGNPKRIRHRDYIKQENLNRTAAVL